MKIVLTYLLFGAFDFACFFGGELVGHHLDGTALLIFTGIYLGGLCFLLGILLGKKIARMPGNRRPGA